MKMHKSPKLNTLEQLKMYKYHKIDKNEILNYQITYNDHILVYDIITQ